MYQPRMTKQQARTAARHLIVTFHEELPDLDTISVYYLIHQFRRDLSAAVQHDVDADILDDILDTLDRWAELYFRTGEYTHISEPAATTESEHISNVIDDDLHRMFDDYQTRPAYYFETAA